jgi:hypothetical protein
VAAIPKDLPPRSTVYDYFDLWSWDGTLDRINEALYTRCREEARRLYLSCGPQSQWFGARVGLDLSTSGTESHFRNSPMALASACPATRDCS